MTVEERAKKAFDAFMNAHYMELSDESVMSAITQALRDQIEDCAKVAEAHHDCGHDGCFAGEPGRDIAEWIRDLAAPREEKPDDDQVEDRFQPGGFWFP